MSKQLQKAIELAKKTGDRIIIFNGQEDENAQVVIPFEEYEKIINSGEKKAGLTRGQMIDNINRDVAEWKNSHSFGFSGQDERNLDDDFVDEDEDFWEDDDEEYDEDDDFYAEGPFAIREERESYESKYLDRKKKKKNNAWRIPHERKTQAAEIIEEDRQYLEEIPF